MITHIKGFTGPYAWLSNFYIEPDGTCVEVEYQRAKCADFEGRKKFPDNMAPGHAKKLGSKVRLREDWDEVKVNIMLFYVTKKFRDHKDLRILLQLTGTAHIEETNWWGDTFWGVCKGVGQNILGDILMQVRGELG